MNTFMWENPATLRHFRMMAEDHRGMTPPTGLTFPDLVRWIEAKPGLTIIPPISKKLACQDEGIGAMAELDVIVETASRISCS